MTPLQTLAGPAGLMSPSETTPLSSQWESSPLHPQSPPLAGSSAGSPTQFVPTGQGADEDGPPAVPRSFAEMRPSEVSQRDAHHAAGPSGARRSEGSSGKEPLGHGGTSGEDGDVSAERAGGHARDQSRRKLQQQLPVVESILLAFQQEPDLLRLHVSLSDFSSDISYRPYSIQYRSRYARTFCSGTSCSHEFLSGITGMECLREHAYPRLRME